jgi:hypothetical protein
MMLRALKMSGLAALVFAGVSGGSQPAAAQCCGYGYYQPAPVVVQPYYNSCGGCGGCGGCGSAYYPSVYPYGYGAAGSAYALDYGYAGYGGVAVGPRYRGYGWRGGCCGY